MTGAGIVGRWTVGDVRITGIVEAAFDVPLTYMFPAGSAAGLDAGRPWLEPDFISGADTLRMAINSFVVETGGRRIVVDTAVGPGKERSFALPAGSRRDYLGALAAAGVPAAAVDVVVCTHLHWDHVGWNTTLVDDRWMPTFPNARYLVAEPEWAYWSDRRRVDGPADPDSDAAFADSVRPLVDAGLVDVVGVDEALSAEVRLVPAAGHTPGHVAVWIDSGGRTGAITGDLLHSPVQLLRPEWAPDADVERDVAVRTRRDFFDRCATAGALVMGTHFAAPTAGTIVVDGDHWRLDTVSSAARPASRST